MEGAAGLPLKVTAVRVGSAAPAEVARGMVATVVAPTKVSPRASLAPTTRHGRPVLPLRHDPAARRILSITVLASPRAGVNPLPSQTSGPRRHRPGCPPPVEWSYRHNGWLSEA